MRSLDGKSKEKKFEVPCAELEKQKEYSALAGSVLASKYPDKTPLAMVHTYGCQGNVSDGERIKGLLAEMGYGFTDDVKEADLVLYNTCAIREHAEDIHRLPEFLYSVLSSGKRVFCSPDGDGVIAEDLPVRRDSSIKGWLPIMYGCNNFCSYCIVPYVRGRERSRESEKVIEEAKALIASGCKDITLLGQNVNSYGKTLSDGTNFASLLKQINDLPGDFIIRFMTSHPKDCTKELLDTMAECKKVARHLHLPFQSGNNRVLKEMNRGYTREKYLSLVEYAKKVMPDISLTSDIIVGFPGETYEEFKDTLSLIKEAKFTSLYTFIFSPRDGTRAAKMPDPVSREEKGKWFKELCDLQESIAAERTAAMKGKTYRVLCEGYAKDGVLEGRTAGNVMIEVPDTCQGKMIGKFCNVKVTDPLTWIVRGELQE